MLLHSPYVLREYSTHDNLRVRYDLYGKSTSGGDDAKRSNDSNTNHVPNNGERTTNPGSNPNTKDYTKRTMRRTRTNRISAVYKRIPVR